MKFTNQHRYAGARNALAFALGGALLAFASAAAANAPTGLTANVTAAGDAVELGWNPYTFPIDCSGAAAAQQIRAESSFNGGAFASVGGNVQATSTLWTLTELAEGSFEFRIQARCPGFESAWSQTASAVISLAPPCAGAPDVIATATPTVLWPPNGKMVSVIVSGSVMPQANCVMPEAVHYFVDDEYGDLTSGVATADVVDGTFEFLVDLEAMRYGHDMDGRRYDIGVETADEGSTSIQVVVPHDQRRR